MQSIYTMHQHQSDQLDKEEKFLFQSIENTQDLYLLLLSALVEIKKKEELYIDLASKKHLATKEERNPSLKFVHNKVLMAFANSAALENIVFGFSPETNKKIAFGFEFSITLKKISISSSMYHVPMEPT